MTDYEIATLATSVAIGLGQIGILWYGIRTMNRASAERARDRRQAARVADQRHAETLATADQRHAETLQTADQRHTEASWRHTETMATLDMQRQALETLIVRTAAPAAG